jgi:type I site-specific restriction-modification system R (restriction) subunit
MARIPEDLPAKIEKVLAPLRAEGERLDSQRSSTLQALAAAKTELAKVKDADAQALALAIRAGTKEPASDSITKTEAKIAALERQLNALNIATSASNRDLEDAIDKHKDRFTVALTDTLTEDHARLLDALAILREHAETFTRRRHLRAWLSNPKLRKQPTALAMRNGGSQTGIVETIDDISARIEELRPRAAEPDLKQVVHETERTLAAARH